MSSIRTQSSSRSRKVARVTTFLSSVWFVQQISQSSFWTGGGNSPSFPRGPTQNPNWKTFSEAVRWIVIGSFMSFSPSVHLLTNKKQKNQQHESQKTEKQTLGLWQPIRVAHSDSAPSNSPVSLLTETAATLLVSLSTCNSFTVWNYLSDVTL